jgi:ion channel-forming bestrophin family protein
MVIYNPKDWFKLIFRFHKSDTFRILIPAMFAVGIYTFIVNYIEIEVWGLKYKSTTLVHSLLGFVISLLLVFRTNTAYERWWEGRKLWGSLVNNCRNLAVKLNVFLGEDTETKEKFEVFISNYPFVLKEHLRNGVRFDELQKHPALDIQMLSQCEHVPNALSGIIFKEINNCYKKGKISGDQLIVLNEEFKSLADIMGACERIKKTPIPYSYSLFIKKFIFIYVMTMPFGFVSDFRFWSIPIVIFTFYVLASLELIAEEIEDPFGMDANDLPTDDIALRIKENMKEIFSQ